MGKIVRKKNKITLKLTLKLLNISLLDFRIKWA